MRSVINLVTFEMFNIGNEYLGIVLLSFVPPFNAHASVESTKPEETTKRRSEAWSGAWGAAKFKDDGKGHEGARRGYRIVALGSRFAPTAWKRSRKFKQWAPKQTRQNKRKGAASVWKPRPCDCSLVACGELLPHLSPLAPAVEFVHESGELLLREFRREGVEGAFQFERGKGAEGGRSVAHHQKGAEDGRSSGGQLAVERHAEQQRLVVGHADCAQGAGLEGGN